MTDFVLDSLESDLLAHAKKTNAPVNIENVGKDGLGWRHLYVASTEDFNLARVAMTCESFQQDHEQYLRDRDELDCVLLSLKKNEISLTHSDHSSPVLFNTEVVNCVLGSQHLKAGGFEVKSVVLRGTSPNEVTFLFGSGFCNQVFELICIAKEYGVDGGNFQKVSLYHGPNPVKIDCQVYT